MTTDRNECVFPLIRQNTKRSNKLDQLPDYKSVLSKRKESFCSNARAHVSP